MKYLKGYKLFENKVDILSDDVEEAFYSISDKYTIKSNSAGERIRVSIYSKDHLLDHSKLGDLIKLNDIKDDLEFAVNYVTKELGLKLVDITIQPLGRIRYIPYRNLKSLFNDYGCENVKLVKLEFSNKN